METKREFLHFGEIAAALLRRHGLADVDEMLKHLRLALRAEFAEFDQFFLRGGGDVCAVVQRSLKLGFFGGDLRRFLFRQPACLRDDHDAPGG